ncbi:hypothetical protein CO701_15870 [Citrobacter werkmanii]|nr:hypothetical protein CO701_15870 [Citrobacter werkmanii]
MQEGDKTANSWELTKVSDQDEQALSTHLRLERRRVNTD